MIKPVDFKTWFKSMNYHPQDCKHCDGTGLDCEELENDLDPDPELASDCPRCQGTGKKITITHIKKYQRERERDERLLNRYLAGTVTQ